MAALPRRGDAPVRAALLLACAALLSCGRPSPTSAPAPAGPADPCPEAGTQAELTMCWGAEGRRAEAEEQASLDRVTKLLRERSDTAAVDALTRSETAWTTYRDAHCAAVAAVYESGSLGP